MAGCTRCPCGQFLDPDDPAASCPACGRMSVPRRPDRSGLAVVAVVAGLLVALTVGLLTISILRRPTPLPPVAVPVEIAVAPAALPEPARPAVVPPVEPPPAPPNSRPPEPAKPEPPRVEVPVDPPPRTGELESAVVPPPGGYRLGETVRQDVVVTRRTVVRLLGSEVSLGGQYALRSSLVVTAVKADGSLAVEQTITAARLIDSDPDLRGDLAAALEKAQGKKFELTVGPTGDVTAVKDFKDPIRVRAGRQDDFTSLRAWSLVDADGWKELAGLTFFQPEGLKAGTKWSKPTGHDWGELGRWTGKLNFLARGKVTPKSPLDRVEFARELRYELPAVAAKGELPFRVGKADFKAAAIGAIDFDGGRSRATAAEERFHVSGRLTATVIGPEVAIEVEELQNFKLAIGDPAAGELTGRKPKK